jgi:hypothetical protein
VVIDGADTTEISETIVDAMQFGDISGSVLPADQYKLELVRVLDQVVLDTYIGQFSDGLWTWMYVVGEPSTPRIVREDKTPLPARPK